MVELDQVGDVDGVLVRVSKEDPNAGLELTPAGLCDLEGGLEHLSHGHGEAGVQLEDHLLHEGREVFAVRTPHEERPLVGGQVVGSPSVEECIALS